MEQTSSLDDVLGKLDPDEPDEVSMSEIYKQLTINDDIILVIDKEDEASLRTGLASVKYKTNKAIKESGIGSPESRTIEFRIIPWTPEEMESETVETEGRIKLQIFLKARSSIRVHQLIVTDKEF